MTECQQLETENGQHEADIASLKREIRQKQRTMATLELMLLNVSASSRINNSAKENAAREANNLVDELLANQADSAATEEGSITNAVSCVLCGKRFVSAEYLLRHQQRRHQDTKKNKKKKSSSGSSSDTDSKKKKKRKKSEKPAPLPKEILDALEEKNQLAKQLVALQDQVRIDQETRDRQRQQLENQQQQMSSRVEQYMEKLQTTLVGIEKKQEDTKHDLLQYTQEAISRLQMEAANAELMRIQAQKNSRAGKLENDDEEAAKFDAKWSEKVEKMMDTFLRAQAQKQQEIDALEQESSKLWTKYNKLKKRQHRPEPTMRLTDLATLDAERFGVDRGEVVETETKPVARLEDKRIQTDDEDEGKDEFEAEHEAVGEITASMTYHRVLLHHKQTGAELSGDMLIYELKNNVEVEIIPYHEVAAMQVGEVIETHAIVSNRIGDIKRASMGLSASDLPTLEDENDTRDRNASLARLVRLQSFVRGFLAKKNVELMKIDRLMDARLLLNTKKRSEGWNRFYALNYTEKTLAKMT
ncbi:hypothetical protein JG688_00012028 [Phytophthora aleatoria]|uniref:C2H2-type domain-containing protein n=1 Tax=Phytophthora aleatoria TaxID=2496075 RepID=A0A8J5M2C8_9STRA|nr:hypothetical protein JG688_00012028 [Phytophthora aleatoria]